MRILVSGTGRSGTNLVTEVVRGLGIVEFTKEIEDKRLFKYKTLPECYGTKLSCDKPEFSLENITELMRIHSDFNVVFSFRHPVDICMSKIVRGYGGESPDRTVEGSIFAVRHFYSLFTAMSEAFPARILGVKMESLLLDPLKEVEAVAKFFNVKITLQALRFWEFNRNEHHKRRYKGRINLTQIDVYKRWKTAYNGFFNRREEDIITLRKALGSIVCRLGYEGLE